MRYKAVGDWTNERHLTVDDQEIALQVADCLDTKNNQRYRDGAFRVTVDGKPVKGKGGVTPFFGERAWCQGGNKFDDLVYAMGRAR